MTTDDQHGPFSPAAEREVSELIQSHSRHGLSVAAGAATGHAPAVDAVPDHDATDAVPDHDATVEFWDTLYSRDDHVWSGKVNATLAQIVEDFTPGTALDLGCGEGADAVWLAQRGWTVTGVDVSAIALGRAKVAARDAGVAVGITWQQHDLDETFPAGTFDLVSAQFLQSPLAMARIAIMQQAAAAVAPGGRLVVVGHAAMPAWSDHEAPEGGFQSPEQVMAEAQLNPWNWAIERAEIVTRWVTAPDGHDGPLDESVVVARRLV